MLILLSILDKVGINYNIKMIKRFNEVNFVNYSSVMVRPLI